jgi:hypothetical protein
MNTATDSDIFSTCKAWVCGHSLCVIAGSNPAGNTGVYLVIVVYCQVEVSATGRSLVQRSPHCSVCVCVRERERERDQVQQ